MIDCTIIIPAKNEALGLSKVLPSLKGLDVKNIIVVNDGSTDDTELICTKYDVAVISHHCSKGNGAAIKTGLRHSDTEYVLFMDADAQHSLENVTELVCDIKPGVDMIVGARSNTSQASVLRGFANKFYNWFASMMVGFVIPDLTSGLRLVNRKKMLEFIHLLPNGFSYPTTITMAFFRAGYFVEYRSVDVQGREGKSHIRPISDGVKFLLIIFKVATLYSPLKVFFPVSIFFSIGALVYYIFTFFTEGRFTNMGLLMFSTSIIVFLMGLISEQITALNYQKK